jgi:hypothetical protein
MHGPMNVKFENYFSVYQNIAIFHLMALRNGLLIKTELLAFVFNFERGHPRCVCKTRYSGKRSSNTTI